MHTTENKTDRRTSTDVVFDQLYEEIVSLRILPGTKLSEAEVARRFGVSRQPIRDAFSRLDNQNLILIRPQKATEVRGFSMDRIAHSRFLRLAVELEVITRACSAWDESSDRALGKNISQQHKSIESNNFEHFHLLDFDFHKLICELSGCPAAADTIKSYKQEVDRLCVLSLGRNNEASAVLEEHEEIAKALHSKSVAKAIKITRQHCARLDDTISEIHSTHPEYFEHT